MTKLDWSILASGEPAIDTHQGIVYRNTLQEVLVAYLAAYRERLFASEKLRAAFLRKLDHIAK